MLEPVAASITEGHRTLDYLYTDALLKTLLIRATCLRATC